MVRLEIVGWKDVEDYCRALAELVRESGFRPDVLVAMTRGGWIPCRLIADSYLMHAGQVGTIDIEYYASIGVTHKAPRLVRPFIVDVTGKTVLLVDDVADSGKSLALALSVIREHGATEVRVATLHWKSKTMVRPEYSMRHTENWVVYPWESAETEVSLKELAERGGGGQ